MPQEGTPDLGRRDDQGEQLQEDTSLYARLLSASAVVAIRGVLEATLGNFSKGNSFATFGSPIATLSADQALQAPLKIVQFTLTHDGGGTVQLKLKLVDGSLSISILTDNAKFRSSPQRRTTAVGVRSSTQWLCRS